MVSIHAPVRGSDGFRLLRPIRANRFQSTLPCEGATERRVQFQVIEVVSIHAPVRGSDPTGNGALCGMLCFNPRSRARERPFAVSLLSQPMNVSIHAPVRGSDLDAKLIAPRYGVSIHAPVRGSDDC